MHRSEAPKFLVESSSVRNHAIELVDPFNAAHLLNMPLQVSSVTRYFDLYSQSIAEYENEDIPKIHLIAEEPPWDPSTNEFSVRETQLMNH